MTIFADTAPRYWACGLPAIPLMQREKKPAIHRWQMYGLQMPTIDEQEMMLERYGDCNIGIVCGPQSGLVMLDIDTKDPKILGLLEKILPSSPWTRVGAKGEARVYRYNGHVNFSLRHPKDGMILELLSKGRQLAIPPSIHPDTQRPYVQNCELIEILGIIPHLPIDIEAIVRGALKDICIDVHAAGAAKLSDFVPAGARDNQMVSTAGLHAAMVTRGERTLLEALGQVAHWVENYTEKVAGDVLDPEKAQQKLIEFLTRDVMSGRKSLPPGWDSGLTDEDKVKLGVNFGHDQEKWDVERICKHLEEEFVRHPEPHSSGFVNAVEVALGKIAKNHDIGPMMESRILRLIQSQSSEHYSVSTLKRQLNEYRKGDLAGSDQTELAKATMRDLSQFGEIRFDIGKFWQWKGAAWEIMKEAEIRKHIAENYGHLPMAKRGTDHTGIVKVPLADQALKPLAVIDRSLINFANGMLTEDLELVPHNPDYGMTSVLKFRYLPEEAGKCPMFFQFLHDCWGDDPDFQDKVDALQEAMAVTMFGLAPKYQRAFCLQGMPKSGKSHILHIMKGLMPPEACSKVNPQDWNDKFLPAELYGKRLNVCGELSNKRYIDGDIFKEIVDGTEINAQHKFGQPFEFYPKSARWFASNHIPLTHDTSDAFNRRWLFLEFNSVVSDSKKVTDIDQIILAEEREQIASWAAQGLERLKRKKEFTLPPSHEAIIDRMANENNSIRYLAASPRLRIGREAHQGRSDIHTTELQLHNEYTFFCISTGVAKAVGRGKFHGIMRELGKIFKFDVEIKRAERSGQEIVYKWITLANEAAM